MRPFGVESLNSFCDMSDDNDDDVEAPLVDIGWITDLAGVQLDALRSQHDASASA